MFLFSDDTIFSIENPESAKTIPRTNESFQQDFTIQDKCTKSIMYPYSSIENMNNSI